MQWDVSYAWHGMRASMLPAKPAQMMLFSFLLSLSVSLSLSPTLTPMIGKNQKSKLLSHRLLVCCMLPATTNDSYQPTSRSTSVLSLFSFIFRSFIFTFPAPVVLRRRPEVRTRGGRTSASMHRRCPRRRYRCQHRRHLHRHQKGRCRFSSSWLAPGSAACRLCPRAM